ncbi:hypothetical protein MHBO_001547, partial [Bonamia ostreae]
MVHADVRRRADQNLPALPLRQMVHNRRRRHRLPRPRRTLDQTKRLLHRVPQRLLLRLVQLGQPRRAHFGRQVGGDVLRADLVAQEHVVEKARDRVVVVGEAVHGVLHARVGHRLPNEVDVEAEGLRDGRVLAAVELDEDLVFGGDLEHDPVAVPALVHHVPGVVQDDLVSFDDARAPLDVPVQPEVEALPAPEPRGPTDGDALLLLCLARLAVEVGLEGDQRLEDAREGGRVGVAHHDGLDLVFEFLAVEVGERRAVVAVFPELLQLAQLRGGGFQRARHLALGRRLHEPGQEGALLDERDPLRQVPVHLLERVERETGLSAEQDDDGVGFGGDEAEKEDVLATAVEALERGVAEDAVFVQSDAFVFGAHQVIYDVGARGAALVVAEPFFAVLAADDRVG